MQNFYQHCPSIHLCWLSFCLWFAKIT